MNSEELDRVVATRQFPRSAKYDAQWMLETSNMGPNALWLTEMLCEKIPLEPGMRVLDLGCGRAASSIFLAREFDVTVWAADLMVKPTENWNRVQEAGVAGRVHPLRADARDLPFANEFFDAVVCVSAYQYFGTDALYLRSLVELLRPGGRVGIIVPGVRQDIDDLAPAELPPMWRLGYETYRTATWWQQHWKRTPSVLVEVADWIDGRHDWADWVEICRKNERRPWLFGSPQELKWLRSDAAARFGLVRAVARRAG